MRKVLSILLSILMVFALVACTNDLGNENDKINIENTESDENKNNDVVGDANDGFDETNNNSANIEWELKDLTIDVPEVKIETYTVDGVDEVFEVGVTVYNFTGDDIVETLKNNEFVSQNYTIDDKPSWGEHGFLSDYDSDNGTVYNTHYAVSERVSASNDLDIVFVSVGRDTNELKNNDGFYISFSGIDINEQTQQDTFSVLDDFLGEEMANYLVYAKDADGKKRGNDLEHEFQLYEKIQSGAFVYAIERDIQLNEFRNEITYSIAIDADTDQFNYLFESNHNYEPKYDANFKYKPEMVIPSLGEFDINNHTDLFKEYYLIGSETTYQSSSIDDAAIDYYYSDYGDEVGETYRFSASSEKMDKDSYFANETMQITYSCDDRDDELIDMRIEIEGDIEFDSFDNLSEDDVVARAKDLIPKKLTHILPGLDIDLSTIEFGEQVEIVGEYQHDLVDGKWEYKLLVDLTCEYDDEICFDFEWYSSNYLK